MLFLHDGRCIEINKELDHLVRSRVPGYGHLDSRGACWSWTFAQSKMLIFEKRNHLLLGWFLEGDYAKVGRFAIEYSARNLSSLFPVCPVSNWFVHHLSEDILTLAISPGVRGSKG